MDGDNHLSSTCELEDGTIIVVRDGFETEKEYPKLAILSTDNVFTVRRKLKQYPWIYACGNPILTPFEFEVLEGTENEETPDARILIQGGTGNINVSGPNNVVNVVFPDYRPVDSYRPRERAKVEGICDGWCVAGRIAIGVVVAGLIYSLTRDKGSSSPAPTAPQGNTGGSGNGGTPPQGDTGGTTGGGTPSGD
ncbi:MAG: hypothetical protein Q7K40_00425 [bacterium]|nr:hypothetical protein [bacterium]